MGKILLVQTVHLPSGTAHNLKKFWLNDYKSAVEFMTDYHCIETNVMRIQLLNGGDLDVD